MSVKPGTVALATVRGEKGVRVFRVATSAFDADNWRSERIVSYNVLHEDDDVTDVHPLVVLDLGDDARYYEKLFRRTGYTDLADQIAAQLPASGGAE